MLVHARPRSPTDAACAQVWPPRGRLDLDGRRIERIVGGPTEQDLEVAGRADRVVP